MTMKGYPRIIRDKGEMWMPKETFFNLSKAKKQRIDEPITGDILLTAHQPSQSLRDR